MKIFQFTSLLLVFMSLGQSAFSMQCRHLFKDNLFEGLEQIELPRSSKSQLQRILVEETIRKHVDGESAKLSRSEIEQVRADARKFDSQLERINTRIRSAYKMMNGSKRNRIQDEAEAEIKGQTNRLLLGSIDEVYEGLSRDFSQFEKNYLMIEALRSDIIELRYQKPISAEKIQEKIKELAEADKKFGEDIYIYLELRESLEKLIISDNAEAVQLASDLLLRLKNDARHSAQKYILNYRDISIEEIKAYLKLSSVAEKASLKRAAIREFVTMLKMLTLSGPIVKAVKWVIFKIPERVSFFRMQDVPLRKMVADTFGISEKQHLRDIYIGPINSILEQRGTPARQYELMKSANSLSVEQDGLMLAFARVPENQKEWIAIRDYSASVANENPFNKNFHARVLEVEKRAIVMGEFPLNENEAGATVVGRVAVTAAVSYYVINKYFGDNPEVATSTLESVQGILRIFGI